MGERLSGRVGLVRELGIGIAALATVTSAVDGYYNSYLWNPPVNDSSYQRREQLIKEIDNLKVVINTSNDARENAVRREQIRILDRESSQIFHDEVDKTGLYLTASRFYGPPLSGPAALLFGIRYLEKAYEFIRRRRSSDTNVSPQVG